MRSERDAMAKAIDAAVGGEYRMPDGRAFWIDAVVARFIANRAVDALSFWIETRSGSVEDESAARRETPATAPVSFDVTGYVEGYEFRGDGGGYKPTESEQVMLEDFAHGLIGELAERMGAHGSAIERDRGKMMKPPADATHCGGYPVSPSEREEAKRLARAALDKIGPLKAHALDLGLSPAGTMQNVLDKIKALLRRIAGGA